MTYLMSRANYDRCVAGMSAAGRAAFDREFAPYPDTVSPDGWIDRDRITAAWDDLYAKHQGALPIPRFAAAPKRELPWWLGGPWDADPDGPGTLGWESMAKGNGKSSWRPPPPWEEIGPGAYVAPPGTPMPFYTPDPGPAPTIAEHLESSRTDWFADFIAPQELTGYPRRYFLNDVVRAEPEPANLLEDMLAWWREYNQLNRLPPPRRRIKAGTTAIMGLQFAGRSATLKVPDGRIGDLTGIPIVGDPDLPDDVFQLIDDDTGAVLYEGVMPWHLAEMAREYLGVMSDAVDQLADESGVPRDLLRPPDLLY
jgi:hypothetical protein